MSQQLTVIFDGEVLRPEKPINLLPKGRYKITIEPANETENQDHIQDLLESDENDQPIQSREEILADFRQAWHEAMTEETLPISQLWEEINNV